MAEKEPADAHFEAWRRVTGGFARYRVATVEGRENWIIPGGEVLTLDYLNSLEAHLATAREALREIEYKTTHADWIMKDEKFRRQQGGNWSRQQWIADIALAALESTEEKEA